MMKIYEKLVLICFFISIFVAVFIKWLNLNALNLSSVFPFFSNSSSSSYSVTPPAPPLFDHQYLDWQRILNQNIIVENGQHLVRYGEIKKKERDLDLFLHHLSKVQWQEFERWEPEKKLAFLINSYNAFTVKHVLNHFPIRSINDIGDFFANPWEISFFSLFQVQRNLDWIRYEMIHKKFPDPRLHLVLHCAAMSGPALRNEPYVASQLEQQLEDQTRKFLLNPLWNKISITQKQIELSQVFSSPPWFGRAFSEKFGSIENFISQYITKDPLARSHIQKGDFKILFIPFDWRLNDKKD